MGKECRPTTSRSFPAIPLRFFVPMKQQTARIEAQSTFGKSLGVYIISLMRDWTPNISRGRPLEPPAEVSLRLTSLVVPARKQRQSGAG